MPLTARQQTILSWLDKAYPHAADQFLSGLLVRETEGLPCRASLMAHAFREACIAINNVHSSNSRKLDPAVEAMVAEYRRLNYARPLSTPAEGHRMSSPDTGSVAVSVAFMDAAAEIVAIRDSEPTGRDRTHIAFRAISGESGTLIDITPTADRWHEMYRYFVRCAHNAAAASADLDSGRFDQELQFFEETLESFAQSAIANLDDLDTILADANS